MTDNNPMTSEIARQLSSRRKMVHKACLFCGETSAMYKKQIYCSRSHKQSAYQNRRRNPEV